MKQCNHEPIPHAGYGATVGEHVCQYCGEIIKWVGGEGGQYAVLSPNSEPHNTDKDSLWLDILWACVIALVLAIVSAARHG